MNAAAAVTDDLPASLWISPEDYLDRETRSEIRHEYAAGRVTAMAGASEQHEIISGNLHARLWNHLRGSGCRVFKEGLKLKVQRGDAQFFYYPDVMVVCDPEDRVSPYYKERPVVLIEVLSPGTETIDQEVNRFAYTSIPGLRSYVLVSQSACRVQHLCRRENDWDEVILTSLDDVLNLPETGLSLTLAEIYDGITPDRSPA